MCESKGNACTHARLQGSKRIKQSDVCVEGEGGGRKGGGRVCLCVFWEEGAQWGNHGCMTCKQPRRSKQYLVPHMLSGPPYTLLPATLLSAHHAAAVRLLPLSHG